MDVLYRRSRLGCGAAQPASRLMHRADASVSCLTVIIVEIFSVVPLFGRVTLLKTPGVVKPGA